MPAMTTHGLRNRPASENASSCVLSPISLTATSAKLLPKACQFIMASHPSFRLAVIARTPGEVLPVAFRRFEDPARDLVVRGVAESDRRGRHLIEAHDVGARE